MMEVGVDRIMFSTDHPYASNQERRTFLDHIPVSPSGRKKIAHKKRRVSVQILNAIDGKRIIRGIISKKNELSNSRDYT